MVSNKLVDAEKGLQSSVANGALVSIGALGLTIGLIFWPFAIIWSLNTLFSLHIQYTFWTWLSMYVLSLSVGGMKISNVKKD